MYPVAHGWLVARLLDGSVPDAALLGCVWPDMLFGSPLTHAQSHQSGAGLLNHACALPASASHDEALSFVRGVISHGSAPHGFDWFSDESWGGQPLEAKGFAFQRGASIAEETARACGVPLSMGQWKAHNIIEMAFERMLLNEDPVIGERLTAVCADTALIERMAEFAAGYFDAPVAQVAESMRRYASVVCLRPDSVDPLAKTYALQTRLKHPGSQPDVGALARLLGNAEALIASECASYLDVCLAEVRATLDSLGAMEQ